MKNTSLVNSSKYAFVIEETPHISIIIPVYNAERTIMSCLESILLQNVKKSEIIIVDDASTDKTPSIVNEIIQVRKKRSPSMTFIRLKENRGASHTRNKGVAVAKGEILVFLDADCTAYLGWLEEITAPLKNKGIIAAASQYNRSTADCFIGHFAFYELAFRDKDVGEFIDAASSCNFACRKSDFFTVGGFSLDKNAEPAEDIDFFFRLSKKGKIQFVEKARVGHFFRDTLSGYLKQQQGYSRSSAYLFLKKYGKRMLREKTLQKKTTYIEIAATIGFLFLVVILMAYNPFYFLVSVFGFLLLIFFLNMTFIAYIIRNASIGFALKSIPLIYLRNMYWILGIFQGCFLFLKNTKNQQKLFKQL